MSRVYAKGLINQEPIAPAAGLKEGPVPAWSTQHRIAANRTLSALPAKAYGGILDCDEESRAASPLYRSVILPATVFDR